MIRSGLGFHAESDRVVQQPIVMWNFGFSRFTVELSEKTSGVDIVAEHDVFEVIVDKHIALPKAFVGHAHFPAPAILTGS
jgi:hypothetical protein